MDQVKIGKFISECRKKNNLTQAELAEKLDITDRAVSKWENGKSMPDSGIMIDLCNELKISVNELLSGEVVEMKDYNVKAEENLLELKKQKEETDKRLLNMEIIFGILVLIFFLFLTGLAAYADMNDNLRMYIIVSSTIFIVLFAFVALRIEQVAGYYECGNCHHKYIPTYSKVLWAPHFGRTRWMRCPECKKKSWNKKVLSK